MRNDDRIRIQHIIDACNEISTFIKGITRQELDEDRKLVLAIIKEIEIIGEAANKISNESKESYPDIPWADIIGMRNHLIHSYFDIDTEVVWTTALKDIPELLSILQRIINKD
ncbi:MAG: HepT-like ribonuclease domain-containing protein [Ignavibacteria bacterium]